MAIGCYIVYPYTVYRFKSKSDMMSGDFFVNLNTIG